MLSGAVVSLEVLSKKPLGMGVYHGWRPTDYKHFLTHTEGRRVITIDDRPAIETFQSFAEETRQPFDRSDPQDLFLHNMIGIGTK